ncbi:MAG TPA: thiamine pyrophosphate-binding protein [Polyangiaceae bacterium]|nr:thiamine pyrophosphate-binding protein [Polyangiaceae bacterium]
MKVSDFIASRLVELGIRHVFGVGGANIEDMFAAVQRRRPDIRMVLGKHEHAAGTAADASARLTGGLGVVFVTSGGGAMNLLHSVAEARASAVSMLAVVGEPPTALQGVGAFQDTSGRGGAIDAAAAFEAVSVWCKRVERVETVPQLLNEALDAARSRQPGPAVLLLAKDFQLAELAITLPPISSVIPAALPDAIELERAAALLRIRPVLVIAGDEVARTGAQQQFAEVVEALDAQVAVVPEARDAYDNFSPRFVGVSGAMGSSDVAHALARAAICLVVGTRLPVLARQGLEDLTTKPLLSVGRRQPYLVSSRGLHLEGSLPQTLRALAAALGEAPTAADRATVPHDLGASFEHGALTTQRALQLIQDALPAECTVLVDAGNTGAAAVHALRIPRSARWLLAMGMAGMGYAFGAAVGAAFATQRRCFVLAGDGAFYMHGLDIHTAVEHRLPVTYIIFNNRAHGMCLVRERLLLRENAGYNAFRDSHLGEGLRAMFPGLVACDCRNTVELAHALEQAAPQAGPCVISLELEHVEVPPFAAFQRPSQGLTTVSRGFPDDEH